LLRGVVRLAAADAPVPAIVLRVVSAVPPTTPQAPPRRQGWTTGRTVGAVSGTALAVIGLLIAIVALAIIGAYAFGRDDDGFLKTGTAELKSDGYAITTENIDLGDTTDTAPDDLLGTVRVRAEADPSQDVFIGVGPRTQVESYLGGVEHSVLTDIDDPEYREVAGG
jgi:hypothetical protein